MRRRKILDALPQKPPFRFVDEIVEVDDERIVGRYTFRGDESFYAGHFPGRPVTPGVILLEAMCQVGLVALGIHLLSKEEADPSRWTTYFSDAEVVFSRPVIPPATVTIRAEKVAWRLKRLKARIEMIGPDGEQVARANASGMGVKDA